MINLNFNNFPLTCNDFMVIHGYDFPFFVVVVVVVLTTMSNALNL